MPALQEALRLLARHRSLHNFLRQVSGFRRLPFPVLRALLEHMDVVQVAAESRIIRQGDGPGPMYVIQQGRVRVFRETDSGVSDVAFLRDGDFFGELSVLAGRAPGGHGGVSERLHPPVPDFRGSAQPDGAAPRSCGPCSRSAEPNTGP